MTRNKIKEIINLLKPIEETVTNKKENKDTTSDLKLTECKDKLGNKVIVGDYVCDVNIKSTQIKKIVDIFSEKDITFLKVYDILSDTIIIVEPYKIIKKDKEVSKRILTKNEIKRLRIDNESR